MKTPEQIKKGLEYASTTNIARKVMLAKAGKVPYAYMEEAASDALTYIRELEAKVPQWISVEERLPETDNYCIVFEPGYGYEVCMYYGDGEWLTPDLSNVTRFVSHWMPLPELLKGEQHEK